MSNKEDKLNVIIAEGGTANYIKGFKDTFGGVETENGLIIENGPVELELEYYTIEGVEFFYVDFMTKKPLIITRTPDDKPELLHLNILTEANFTRSYQKQKTEVDAENKGDVFLYNAMFPAEGEFPAHTKLKYLGFKINLNSMGPIFKGLEEVFAELFNENVGLAYRKGLSTENEKLISDIFSFGNLGNGKVSLITARALEVLTNVALHFINEVNKDELAGLHIDDFNTLTAIKKKIISNLDISFTIEELSLEFGVSPTKLKKDFKHLFGTSIYKFYNQARMDEAYRRLKSGKFSVSEVGYDLGYSSLSKFSSMFKKVKGILPNEVEKIK